MYMESVSVKAHWQCAGILFGRLSVHLQAGRGDYMEEGRWGCLRPRLDKFPAVNGHWRDNLINPIWDFIVRRYDN